MHSPEDFDAATLTDIGLNRENNEDIGHIAAPPPGQEMLGTMFLVFDGMGGLGGGDLASQVGRDYLIEAYYKESTIADLTERILYALRQANEQVRHEGFRNGFSRIGTTLAGLVLAPENKVVIFNVGDCRVYRIRHERIERLSVDQSQMERDLENGVSVERAYRNSSLVTSYLGQPETLDPVIRTETAQPADVFIICSDGLWSLLTPEAIIKAVKGRGAAAATRRLVNLALQRGAPDNVTVVVVRLGDSD